VDGMAGDQNAWNNKLFFTTKAFRRLNALVVKKQLSGKEQYNKNM
jgi:hypothetical protein